MNLYYLHFHFHDPFGHADIGRPVSTNPFYFIFEKHFFYHPCSCCVADLAYSVGFPGVSDPLAREPTAGEGQIGGLY